MHDICIFLICFCSKIIFDQKVFSFCWDKLDYPGSIVYLSCFDVFVQKSFLTKNYFLTAEINLTTWGPFYTCLVCISILCNNWTSTKISVLWPLFIDKVQCAFYLWAEVTEDCSCCSHFSSGHPRCLWSRDWK